MKKLLVALCAVLPLVTAAVGLSVPAAASTTYVYPAHDCGGDNS